MKPRLIILTSNLPYYNAAFIDKVASKPEIKNLYEIEIWLNPKKNGIYKKINLLIKQISRSALRYVIGKLFYFYRYQSERSSPDEHKKLVDVLLKYNIPIKHYKQFSDIDTNSSEDILLSLYFDSLIPSDLLKKFEQRAINLHPSLIPDYKGSSPVFWVLANNEKITGYTFHILSERIDSGQVLFQSKEDIAPTDTFHSLYLRLSSKAGECFANFLLTHNFPHFKENFSKGSYHSTPTSKAYKMFKENGRKFI